jgi:hypothetical protein
MILDGRPILIFDTSAVNRLADDSESEALVAGLKSGYFVRFPFTVVSEIIATTSGERRKQLLRVARTLLLSAGDCIEPHHEMLRIMVERFEKSLPLGIEYVNLRMHEAEREIFQVENFNDDLAKQEREEGRTNQKVFVGVYSNARAAFDRLAVTGAPMPKSVAELTSLLQTGGAFWTLGKNIFDRVAARPSENTTVQRFYSECEPFRAMMIAVVAAQYDRCIRSPKQSPSLKAGRNDTFMATCLPYCHQVVTNDEGQLWCYREVVSIAGFDVAVRSYDEFRDRLFVFGGTTVASARV